MKNGQALNLSPQNISHRERQRLQREKRSYPDQFVVCRGPGRFHGGTPMNGLSRQNHGRNSRFLRGSK